MHGFAKLLSVNNNNNSNHDDDKFAMNLLFSFRSIEFWKLHENLRRLIEISGDCWLWVSHFEKLSTNRLSISNYIYFSFKEGNEEENSFWDDLDNSGTDNEGNINYFWLRISYFNRFLSCLGSEDEEESSAFKEVVLNFSDFEKRWVESWVKAFDLFIWIDLHTLWVTTA